mmetsp:Transcript_5212/g.11574  ORF Transcript_5212/g.11574 Transcript_5212/m.11574 type:complete len:301 (-) Transcript_5212:126-1028(-)
MRGAVEVRVWEERAVSHERRTVSRVQICSSRRRNGLGEGRVGLVGPLRRRANVVWQRGEPLHGRRVRARGVGPAVRGVVRDQHPHGRGVAHLYVPAGDEAAVVESQQVKALREVRVELQDLARALHLRVDRPHEPEPALLLRVAARERQLAHVDALEGEADVLDHAVHERVGAFAAADDHNRAEVRVLEVHDVLGGVRERERARAERLARLLGQERGGAHLPAPHLALRVRGPRGDEQLAVRDASVLLAHLRDAERQEGGARHARLARRPQLLVVLGFPLRRERVEARIGGVLPERHERD